MGSRYGLVVGQGRSGTNWIMSCLDASDTTFCRNEPNECVPSFLDPLTNHWRIGADGAALGNWWDRLIKETINHMGDRDHRLNNPKVFVRPISQRLGIAQLSARPTMRKVISRVLWSWADGEWKMPPWVGDLDNPDVLAILKLTQSYNWATWVLDNRPDVPVLQVVRHPGARHDSFLRRYIATADAEQVRLRKIEQLRQLAPEKAFSERMGPVDNLSLAQAETWFGVYQMEAFETRAQGSSKYLRVVYEEMVADPAGHIEKIFEHFGLPLTSNARAIIDRQRDTSVFGAVSTKPVEQSNGWRQRLDAQTANEIQEILDTSPIASWWDSEGVEGHRAA